MSKDYNTVFERVEVKYWIPNEKYEAFRRAAEQYMQLDEYGLTTICNIYYDTENNDLVSRSLKKPVYKEKLRLRSYGIPANDTIVFAEIKKKFDGVVYKRRAALPLVRAEAFLNSGIRPEEDSQIIREIAYFRDFYKPKARLFLAYDREAFFGKYDPELRFTIDRNIRYRENDLFLSKGDSGTCLYPEGGYLLEIKVQDALPLYLTHILTEFRIFPVSFSKYGQIYSVNSTREVAVKPYNKISAESNERGYALCSQA